MWGLEPQTSTVSKLIYSIPLTAYITRNRPNPWNTCKANAPWIEEWTGFQQFNNLVKRIAERVGFARAI